MATLSYDNYYTNLRDYCNSPSHLSLVHNVTSIHPDFRGPTGFYGMNSVDMSLQSASVMHRSGIGDQLHQNFSYPRAGHMLVALESKVLCMAKVMGRLIPSCTMTDTSSEISTLSAHLVC